ncbi:hypothetical protein [Mycobacteroides abscessus]|uniref:TrbL/VirB6 plasmid conjugal transfer protein n=1 Tax=Mycobacteroides abscessus TaxID=36809 RepID=A0A0U0ZQW0_9MYCO|nr:hypothetical protein [Mycobacteroides abscessus]CPV66095.1 Uncharacterised protein [Mycobacteroides abscessus]
MRPALALPRRLQFDPISHPPHLVLAGIILRWVHSGSRWRARLFYGLIIWQLVGLFLMVVAGPAFAAPDTDSGGNTAADPSVLGWMDIKDSSNIPVADYFIAIDHGNAVSLFTGGDKKVNLGIAPLLEAEYGLIKITVLIGLWIIDYGLSFEWMDYIATPFAKLGQAMEGFTSSIGIIGLFLTLAGGVAAIAIVRGHFSRATYQIVSAIIICTLMTTVLAHPVAELIGSDGYLAKARDIGMAASSGLAQGTGGSPTDSASARTKLQHSLADSFARKPTQIINFNTIVDKTSCKGVWETGIRGKNPDKLKDSIAKCNKDMKYAADHLSGDRIGTALLIWVMALVLLVFAAGLLGKVVLSVFLALINAIIFIIVGLGGTVAGPLQTTAYKCLCNIGLAILMIPVTVIYAGAYCSLLNSMLEVGGSPVRVMMLATLMLVIALLAFRRINAGLKQGQGNVLSWISQGGRELPNAQPSRAVQAAKHGVRRTSALAITAGAAALGVPPTITGLARHAGKGVRNAIKAPKTAATQNNQSNNNYNQYLKAHSYSQYANAYGQYTNAYGQWANTQNGNNTPAPAQAPVTGTRVTVMQQIQHLPPLHPAVATAVGAAPHRVSPTTSMPTATAAQRPGPITPHRQRATAPAPRRPQPTRPAQRRTTAAPQMASTP